MGEVVNLNQYRKRRAREEEARQARSNRAKFGRTRAGKASQETAAKKAGDAVEQTRLETGAETGTEIRSAGEPPEGNGSSA